MNPLAIPAVALDVAQVQIAQAKAPVALIARQSYQPVRNFIVLGTLLGFVPISSLADGEDLAGQSNRRPFALHSLLGHLAAAGWPHHFFVIASLRISAFSRSSAYIFLSRAFSSSSSFMREIIGVSMPPYFARHL